MRAVYLPTLIMSCCSGLIIPIMPLYARSFDLSYGLVGWVLAAQGLGTLLCDVPAGVLVRRLGHKRVMLLGIALTLGGVLALFWAQSLTQVLAYRLLSGAGTALWTISRHAYIADLIQIGQRGRSIAIFGGLGRIGAFAGPALGGFIGTAFGLRAPFLVYAVLGVICLVVVFAWVEREECNGEDTTTQYRLGSVLKAHYGPLLTAGSGQLCAQLIRAARHVIIPLYGAEVLGLELGSVGLIVSLSSAIDMLMFYPAGLIMDRWGRKYAYVPSFIIQSLGMALIPLAGSFAGLLGVSLLIGLGNGLGSGTMMTLGADLAPAEARGEFLGLWRFVGDVGSAGGPLVVGHIADISGLSTAPLVVAGIGLLGVAILGGLVPETLKRQSGG